VPFVRFVVESIGSWRAIARANAKGQGTGHRVLERFPTTRAGSPGGLRLACGPRRPWLSAMIVIRFPDHEMKHRALGYLAGRFSGKSWGSGEVMVPEEALACLAAEGIRFTVEGPATYERLAPLRDPAALAVQC